MSKSIPPLAKSLLLLDSNIDQRVAETSRLVDETTTKFFSFQSEAVIGGLQGPQLLAVFSQFHFRGQSSGLASC